MDEVWLRLLFVTLIPALAITWGGINLYRLSIHNEVFSTKGFGFEKVAWGSTRKTLYFISGLFVILMFFCSFLFQAIPIVSIIIRK